MLSSVRKTLITKTALEGISKRCNKMTSNVSMVCGAAHVRREFHTTTPRWKQGSYTVNHDEHTWYGTTIICVRKNGTVCMIGDGQVTQGSTMVKGNARKIRRIKSKSNADATEGVPSSQGTIVGFAGSTADAFTLLDRLEEKLDEYPGQLDRACVELAKGWRMDKYLRRLDAAVLVANERQSFEVTGMGDVLESPTGILGIGSGSVYAIAAARALMDIPELSAEEVARKAMVIASDMCIYTNSEYSVDSMQSIDVQSKEADAISNLAEQPKAEAENDKKEEKVAENDDDSDDEDIENDDKDDKDGDHDDITKK